jgi:hypothetical protein
MDYPIRQSSVLRTNGIFRSKSNPARTIAHNRCTCRFPGKAPNMPTTWVPHPSLHAFQVPSGRLFCGHPLGPVVCPSGRCGVGSIARILKRPNPTVGLRLANEPGPQATHMLAPPESEA